MRVTEFLDKSAVSYQVTEHPLAFTAQQMAALRRVFMVLIFGAGMKVGMI